jgi:Tol biopolymer transport system component
MDGTTSLVPIPPTDHPDAGFSPDGRWLAYTREGQVWIYDLDRGVHRRFTTVGSGHHNPVWSPDGDRLAYAALRPDGNDLDLYVQALSGDSIGRRIGGTPDADAPTQWIPDGTILLNQDLPPNIITLNVERPGAAVPILQADWSEQGGRVSPDGEWLAYQSNESGRAQLLVRGWPGLGQRSVIADSVQSAHQFWSNDNRTLYYTRQGRLMAASLAGTDSLRAESHRVVIEAPGGPVAAIHPDGRRFLVFRPVASQPAAGAAARNSLIVVTGWLTVLRQRLADGADR